MAAARLGRPGRNQGLPPSRRRVLRARADAARQAKIEETQATLEGQQITLSGPTVEYRTYYAGLPVEP